METLEQIKSLVETLNAETTKFYTKNKTRLTDLGAKLHGYQSKKGGSRTKRTYASFEKRNFST